MINKILGQTGSLGTIVSAMGCAACFPVLGSLAASIGLGFMSAFEGVLINNILPALALFVLINNSYLWGRQGLVVWGLLSIAGPLAVLLTLYPFWKYEWSTYLFYFGITLMVVMSILELLKPAGRVCKVEEVIHE